MGSHPRVFASATRVATVDGTGIHLLTVELWNAEQVSVRLVGDLDDRMRSALASYHEAMESWAPELGRDLLPVSPADALHRALEVRLADEYGTEFRYDSGSSGGTGRELLCEWHFRPSPPLRGDRLTLTFIVSGAEGVGSSMQVVFSE
ncbi:hypothetical protein KIF24_05400 [Micromonospora sp. Llam7]|uniref:hypothetical protein n=1 Tax=Micromonospora tarapacensis TaxID=2835305 RepID=UPI001C82D7BF|nr:hypothetical protein [Micromonospora tarapacensis]MBX7265533.1 hypothetical protein [Micromonospora tarapacensis]